MNDANPTLSYSVPATRVRGILTPQRAKALQQAGRLDVAFGIVGIAFIAPLIHYAFMVLAAAQELAASRDLDGRFMHGLSDDFGILCCSVSIIVLGVYASTFLLLIFVGFLMTRLNRIAVRAHRFYMPVQFLLLLLAAVWIMLSNLPTGMFTIATVCAVLSALQLGICFWIHWFD